MNEQQLTRLVATYQQRLANSQMESAQLAIRLEDVEAENASASAEVQRLNGELAALRAERAPDPSEAPSDAPA